MLLFPSKEMIRDNYLHISPEIEHVRSFNDGCFMYDVDVKIHQHHSMVNHCEP